MSIIKPKRRIGASHLGNEVDLGGEYSLASIMKSGIDDTREVNRALLCDFKTQGDVEMYIQLPDYDDFRCFDLSGATDLSVISKRVYGDLRSRHGRPLRIIFLMRWFRRN